jgi:hypothetical protein
MMASSADMMSECLYVLLEICTERRIRAEMNK